MLSIAEAQHWRVVVPVALTDIGPCSNLQLNTAARFDLTARPRQKQPNPVFSAHRTDVCVPAPSEDCAGFMHFSYKNTIIPET